MTQTVALLIDAYRELNARKLFWISMVLSMLIVVIIGAIGFDQDGVSILGWRPEIFQADETMAISDDQLDEARSAFYRVAFNYVGVQIWLTWVAIVLAIFSTAGLFPNLMTTGSIDTLVTKPISRLRLFLTKYCLGLGFVALQVAVFSVGAFVILGIRAGDWEPKLFLAIPIVLLFFSYLYAVCVLVGVWTRSTILAVIVTGLVWGAMMIVNYVDENLLATQADAEVQLEILEQRLEYMQTLPTREELLAENGTEDEDDPDAPVGLLDDPGTREGYANRYGTEEGMTSSIEFLRERAEMYELWRGYAYKIKTPLPKTGETANLMTRTLLTQEDMGNFEFNPSSMDDEELYGMFGGYGLMLANKVIEIRAEQRTWAWIIFTSVMFEVVVVGLAAWKFCRRDY